MVLVVGWKGCVSTFRLRYHYHQRTFTFARPDDLGVPLRRIAYQVAQL